MFDNSSTSTHAAAGDYDGWATHTHEPLMVFVVSYCVKVIKINRVVPLIKEVFGLLVPVLAEFRVNLCDFQPKGGIYNYRYYRLRIKRWKFLTVLGV